MRTSTTRSPRTPVDDAETQDVSRANARGQEAGAEARRLAAAILEVLAGMQTPSAAAHALGISLARYYQVEVRALGGLVSACESRRRGRQSGNELADLRRECERLRRECARQQALVRATRRTVGLAESTPAEPPPTRERRRRRRRPTVRALKVVAQLRAEGADSSTASAAVAEPSCGDEGRTEAAESPAQ